MPIYVYRCTQCERQFEAEQRIVEDPLTHCDVCNAETLRRVIQPVGIAFKGSGFHINDYSGSGSKPEATDSNPETTASTAEPAAPAPAPAAPTPAPAESTTTSSTTP